MSKYNKLQGTRVLVIGGSTGVGYAVAEAALESGATVIVSSSSPSKITTALTSLQAHGAAVSVSPSLVSAFPCDLSSADAEANIVALLDSATENKSKLLNHVVFTAGDALTVTPFAKVVAADISNSLTVRVTGALLVAKHLPAYTVRSNKTSYTVTGGTLATRPVPGMGLVAGVGAAIEGFARGMAVDLRPIRVNCVRAGPIRTPLLGDDPARLELFAKSTLTGTVGKPEEIAEAYLYLMKDSFATATVIESNGGGNVGSSQAVSEFN